MGFVKEKSRLVTILLPCKDQKKEFLVDAITSVINQSSPEWLLYIIVDVDSTAAVKNIINSYLTDNRIKMLTSESSSFAGALNAGMKNAPTEFVSVLLSDDRFDIKAIATLRQNIEKYPDVDFFYSSRRLIDSQGNFSSKIMLSKDKLTKDYFKLHGSPVKHILCWRREKGLAVGGMDEEFSLHGCDDFDFPWKMAEAGCKFKNIEGCLYYYREHRDAYRLTTDVSVSRQVEILRGMFKKHRVSESETENFIRRALESYLVEENTFGYDLKENIKEVARMAYYREISEDRKAEFVSKGYKERHFFPHRIYHLQKSGPDTLRLAREMCGIKEVNKLWEITLHSYGAYIDEFPQELFFDKDIIWHQQHFGKPGHIVFAYLAIKGNNLYGLNYVSDIVQRISRARDYKTRIEKKFEGWHQMLLNGILNFAIENNIKKIYSPTADLAIANTDPTRNVERELFERVYDRAVLEHFNAVKKGEWWVIDVENHKNKVVTPKKEYEIVEFQKTICLCHDIEGGLGHLDCDPDFAVAVGQNYLKNIDGMLAIEKEEGLKATYNITGLLFNDLKEKIEKSGHCLAFHSYEHKINQKADLAKTCKKIIKNIIFNSLYVEQFNQLRKLDYRIRGYRPPQSKITADLSDQRLCYYNFDWLASSANSLKVTFPRMQNRIVKIPISFDDYDMYKKKISYEEWEEGVIEIIKNSYFVAFCLHDCYAQYWLPHYREFLKKIRELGKLKTLDEIANDVIFANAK